MRTDRQKAASEVIHAMWEKLQAIDKSKAALLAEFDAKEVMLKETIAFLNNAGDQADVQRDEYWEEVGKLVDGVGIDIRNGHLKTQDDALNQLENVVASSRYVRDESLMVHVLRYSKNACAHIYYGLRDSRPLPNRPFPWRELALGAMRHDAQEKLNEDEAYAALPS